MQEAATIDIEQPDEDTIGGRLSRAREALAMSTEELARRLGVELPTMLAWERDRAQPRANRLSMLAGLLNVSPSWLLQGVGAAPQEERAGGILTSLDAKLDEVRSLHARLGSLIGEIENELCELRSEGDKTDPIG